MTGLLRTMNGNYLLKSLCQRKDLKKLKLMFWKEQLLKKVQVEDGQQADVVEHEVPRYDSSKINHNALVHMNE